MLVYKEIQMRTVRLATVIIMAMVIGTFFCSCNVSGGSDSYGASASQTSVQASDSISEETVYENEEENTAKAKAVLSGSRLTFYYDQEDHAKEGTVYEVSSTGYNVKGAPWKDSNFIIAKFDASCQDWTPENLSFFFSGCVSVVSIDCTNLNTSNTTAMIRMFNNCSSLVSVDLRGFDTSKVENMDNMFRNCVSLITADIRHFNQTAVDASCGMFTGCSANVIR